MVELEPALKAVAEQIERGEDLDGAARRLGEILAGTPGNAQAQQLAGAVAFRRQDFAGAEEYFRRAARAAPDDAGSANNLGQALRAQDKISEARAEFWRAMALDNVFAEPAMNLGLMAAADGDWADAIEFYAQALCRRINFAEAHFNWAIALERLGEPEGAIGHYRRAIQFRPAYVQAINNLGVLLDDAGKHQEAEALFREGLAQDDGVAELWSSLGSNLRAQGQLDAASEAHGRALTLRPDFPECRWNLALLQLAEGDYDEGWANYRYRPGADRGATPFPGAPWADDQPGAAVNVRGEQGLGDELYFLRFVRELAGRGVKVRYAGDARLRPLLRRLHFIEVADLSDRGDWVSAADLPYLLSARSAPASIRLDAEPAHLARMRARLNQAGPPPYLGITYRAGIKQPGSLYKEISIAALAVAIRNYPGTIVNLQRAPSAGEAADFTACNDDLEDMLALMTLIDHLAGVSNTNMHLRAAAGRRALVLVTHPAEYRWMAAGDTSPWFPDFRLFRQAADGSWDAALAALTAALGTALLDH